MELARNYSPPVKTGIAVAGPAGRQAMLELREKLYRRGITTPHDLVVGEHQAQVLSGGGAAAGEKLGDEDLCALERDAFIALARTPATVARIEHMLGEGRPLRN
jgi:3-hydroxyacyl-CoA dehydrogenase